MSKMRCPLLNGGEVVLDWEKDVQAVIPSGPNTKVIATNGVAYLLRGDGLGQVPYRIQT